MKCVAFERTMRLFTTISSKHDSRTQKLFIKFASGYNAGVLWALISQPVDTLVSQFKKINSEGDSFAALKRKKL